MSVRWDEERKRFIVDYYPDGRKGKRVRLTLPGEVTDLKVALDIEKDLRSPSENSDLHVDSQSTVKELFPLYLEYCHDHMSITTHDNIKWTFEKQFKRVLGDTPAIALDHGHLSMYKRIRKLSGVKNRTVNKEMAYFMGFVRWCRTEKDLRMKDFRYDSMKEDKPQHVILSVDEAMRLILNSDDHYRVFFLTLYSLGLRFSEATGLKWEDLDRANKTINVRGKGGKTRVLPVSDWLLYALDAVRPELATGLIFRSRVTGGPLISVQKAIDRACNKAGIEKHVHPHLLRHTLATHFMAMRINIKIVQEWLGHSQENTTASMYMHAELDHLRSAQSALDEHLDLHLTKEALTPVLKKAKKLLSIDCRRKKGNL